MTDYGWKELKETRIIKADEESVDLDETNLENIIIHQLPTINKPRDYKIALEDGYYKPFRTSR